MAASNEEDDDIRSKEITQQIGDLSINNNDTLTTTCANCGKQGNNINICNKCKAAVYCNAACKKKHRSKHKNACEKRIAELHEEEVERERRAAELHDRELFKRPPPKEDCPICMLPLPSLIRGYKYSACCGKMVCGGCIYAVAIRDKTEQKCAFCRCPAPTTNEEAVEQNKKRSEVDDAKAIYNLGCYYYEGLHGLPQDYAKALELWHQAAELGSATAYYSIGVAYDGNGLERDEKKAIHYFELAAMGGNTDARHNLGVLEGCAGNVDRALKHWMIAAGYGDNDSLEMIKLMFMNGDATKDDYAKTLRLYQAYLVDIKSPQRNEAAAFSDDYKYY